MQIARSLIGRRITLVDDDPFALDVLQRAARSWRFECQAARSAEEAIDLLDKNPTPIVVTDLRMPGKGGTWLVEEVQSRWPQTSIIVVTAGDIEDAMVQCLQAGAHYYFLKPIKLDEFQHALHATLRTYHARWENEIYRRHLEQTLAFKARKQKRTFLSAIASLVRTLEARDPYTSGHSFRVRRYSVGLAKRLEVPARTIRQISLAARLHDIGKVGMAEGILNKPTSLTDEEIGSMRDHPLVGERILRPIIRNWTVLAGIRNHHEKFDGTGYPDGLIGTNIPLVARVIALGDCFDALTSSRPYRTALDSETALTIVQEGAGRHFDPTFVPAFVDLVREQGLRT